MTGFNDGLRSAQESLVIPLSTLRAIEYDSYNDEVQYGPDDHALSKACPLAPQGMLAHLAVEFDQGANQVGDNPFVLKVVNAPTNPPLESGIIAALTVATVDVLENTFEVEPSLVGELASSGEN